MVTAAISKIVCHVQSTWLKYFLLAHANKQTFVLQKRVKSTTFENPRECSRFLEIRNRL
jgi:hypothetical protein